MLEVAVYGDRGVPRGVMEAGRRRDLLAEIAGEFYEANATVGRGEIFYHLLRAISAAVIDKDEFNVTRKVFGYGGKRSRPSAVSDAHAWGKYTQFHRSLVLLDCMLSARILFPLRASFS